MDWRIGVLLGAVWWSGLVQAKIPQEPGAGQKAPPASQIERLPGDMTLARLFDLVRKIDPKAQIKGNVAQFTASGHSLILVGDEHAGRMRIMSPIARVDALDEAVLKRMLQADFDAALDARYAIGNGIVWSVFIHPLPPLGQAQFADAVKQVLVAAATFGSTYTSGALIYGGGDTNKEDRKLLEKLKQQAAPTI